MYLNQERARELMKEHRIDALVASTPENVTYVAGTVAWSLKVYAYSVHMFAVYPQDAGTAPALIVPGPELTYASNQQSWIKDHYTFAGKGALVIPPGSQPQTPEEETLLGLYTRDERRAKNPGAALALALKERKLDKARIALDQDRVMPAVRKQIEEALPDATIIDAADLFRLIRVVKTPDEIAAMTRAAELNEKAASAASRAVAPGITELEAAAVFASEVGKGLGKWQWFHMCSGRRTIGIFPPTEKKFVKGEMWKFDAGLVLDNYQADTGWGGVVGGPTDEQAKIWEMTVAGFDAALSEVKAGALPSKIFQAGLEGTRSAGLPEHNGNFIGHAIGLEQRELPYVLAAPTPVQSQFLPDTTDTPIEEGTTLCIENPVQIFGVGGTQIEKTIRVTRTGYEFLCTQDRKLWVSN